MPIFRSKKFNPTSSVGNRGEIAASSYLKKIGYKILETNYCNTSGRRMGEIDIIAKDGEELVFVEVKTRTNCNLHSPSLPQENITRSKLHKLNKIASYYIFKNKLNIPYRFDAIAITADLSTNTAKLQHLKNIFI